MENVIRIPVAASLLAVSLSLAGCGVEDEAAAVVNEMPRFAEPSTLPKHAEPLLEPVCASGQEWTLSLDASGLGAWEGRRVWVSAVEPAQDGDSTVHSVAARLEATIVDGAASASCVKGLTTNMWYPSAAVVVDVDGSGACSAGDVQQSIQYYGWSSDLVFSLDGATFTEQGFEIGSAWSPVSGTALTWDGAAFCDYYGLDI
jgi:hypothetical protein